MKIIIHPLLFILFFLIAASCNQKNEKSNKITENQENISSVPKLKERESVVGPVGEINKMFTAYYKLKDKIESDPNDYEARLNMADLYIVEARATGDYGYYYDAALKMINKVLENEPEKSEHLFRALTSKAVIFLSMHKFKEALELGEKALAINPHNSRVYGILTDANVEMGNYEEAVKMADKMNSIRPDLRSYSRISYLREIHGDIEGAKSAMKLAVSAGYPGYEETSWSQVTLGKLHENYGDLDSAKREYQLALQTRENYPFAIAGLASLEAKKGNYGEAEELLKKAIDIREEAAFYESLAIVYKNTNQEQAFESAQSSAIAVLNNFQETSRNANVSNDHDQNSNNENEHNHVEGNHSHSEEEHGHHHEHGEMDGHYHEHPKSHSNAKNGHKLNTKENKLVNDHGHSHETGLEMARLYLNLTDNYDEALKNAKIEFEIRPNNIEVNQVLAESYYLKGNYELAEKHFEKAKRTGSINPELLMLGGLVYKNNGKREKGNELIDKSLKSNPYQMSELSKEGRRVKTLAAK